MSKYFSHRDRINSVCTYTEKSRALLNRSKPTCSKCGKVDYEVLLGNGTGNFGAVTNFDVGDTSRFVAAEDFNKDGKPDERNATLFFQ
ncbi:FG-GAP repeat domain-containing protein [Dulcicalothrix desertica]|nr:VCBS repeat-containing protein [Dulcicalothrix desertica]